MSLPHDTHHDHDRDTHAALERLAALERDAYPSDLSARLTAVSVAACADASCDEVRAILDRDAHLACAGFDADRAQRITHAALSAHAPETSRAVVASIGPDTRPMVPSPMVPSRGWTFARRALAASLLIAGGGAALLLAVRGGPVTPNGPMPQSPRIAQTPENTNGAGTTHSGTNGSIVLTSAETFASDIADAWSAFDSDLCAACTGGLDLVTTSTEPASTTIEERWGDWASEGWGEGAL